jgi:cell division inhibitor SulA
VPEWRAWLVSLSGKGWWRLACTPQAHEAMSINWFKREGLVSMVDRLMTLQIKRNRRGTEQVCPVV